MPTNIHTGLTSVDVHRLTLEYGPNTFPKKPQKTAFAILLSQFTSPLVYVLLFACVVSLFLHDVLDSVIIALAVGLNTALGFIQEYKADRALSSLASLVTPQAQVMRDGVLQKISVSSLVPGDIVHIGGGDRIPADGLVVRATKLFINEAILTGESAAVEKLASDDHKTVSMGTICASGRGVFEVTATGKNTRLGAIAGTLTSTKEEATPLQRQLSGLARIIVVVVLAVSVGIFGIGVSIGQEPRLMFLTAVALAVAAIPEGLVVSLTMVLAVGMGRIVRYKAVVRRLVAAETLGSVTVLCIDKTGTVTEGTMRVVREQLFDRTLSTKAAILANNLDDPLEIALWEWTRKDKGVDPQRIAESEEKLDEIPFSGEYKYMAVATGEGMWVKGAPDILLDTCVLSASERLSWEQLVEEYGRAGLRVLALCYKPGAFKKITHKDVAGLTFLGLVGIDDPVRAQVPEMVKECESAGIALKVVTGDYQVTAEAVLAKMGITLTDSRRQIMDGEELERISQEDLLARINDVRLFSRVTPQQKVKIVSALQGQGHVVAMTGDGVNDAMAIKKADIGIVVAGASDVARETADIILLDSNLKTIIAAVAEGRGIFDTMKKVITYLFSGAFAEVVAIIVGFALGIPLPLLPIQILWINFITDGLPSLALTVDPKDPHVMRRKPGMYGSILIDKSIVLLFGVVSVLAGIFTVLFFGFAYWQTGDVAYARTLAFTFLGTCSLLYVFSCRSIHTSIFKQHLFANGWLLLAVFTGLILQFTVIYIPQAQIIFQTVPLTLTEVCLVIGAGLFVVFSIELVKYSVRLHRRRRTV